LVKIEKIESSDGLNWSEAGASEEVAFRPRALCGPPYGGGESHTLRNSELGQSMKSLESLLLRSQAKVDDKAKMRRLCYV
jgi:hypothetical protein